MRLKLSLLHVPGHVLRVFRQKHAKNRWQRKSAITRACAAAVMKTLFALNLVHSGKKMEKNMSGGLK